MLLLAWTLVLDTDFASAVRNMVVDAKRILEPRTLTLGASSAEPVGLRNTLHVILPTGPSLIGPLGAASHWLTIRECVKPKSTHQLNVGRLSSASPFCIFGSHFLPSDGLGI